MSQTGLDARISRVLSQHLDPGARVGIAVSGGGDSVALMHLAVSWANQVGAHLQVATVDHGIRSGSAEEAEGVGRAAGALSLSHHVLQWQGWDRKGNLQDAAREARRTLLSDWARDQGLSAVLLGHTQDDQAETFLMRLARGSGVDGLSAMSTASETGGIRWLRPLLGVSRAELRDWMQMRGVHWIEDPSNDDARFARVRLRKAADALAELGLGLERLSATASSMARARDALMARGHDQAQKLAEVTHGLLHFECKGLADLEAETRLRLLAHGLQWTANAPYRPRLSSLEAAVSEALEGRAATLHGCILCQHNSRLFVAREYAAVAEHVVPKEEVWDGRWRFGIEGTEAVVAPLGVSGVQALDPRPRDLPRAALLSLPGLWAQDRLIAVPVLRWGMSAQIHTLPSKTSFLDGLIPH